MKRFCILLFLFSGFLLASNDTTRKDFLTAYYKGEYQKAHDLLKTFSDPVTRQIWEHRIHLQDPKGECSGLDTAHKSAHAFAELRIGPSEIAIKNFGDDWLSLWGRALYASWTNDGSRARELLSQALTLAATRPELLYMAGDLTSDPQQTIAFFTRYLELEKEDEHRRTVAADAIQFIKKTAGMNIHVVNPPPSDAQFETDFDYYGARIDAMIGGKEKVRLMLDTGASGLVLEKRDWKPLVVNEVSMLGLGKKAVSRSGLMVLDQFQAGPFSVKNPVATISEHLPGADIDGIAGSALFSTHRILVPMKKGKNVVLIPYDQDPDLYLQKAGLKLDKKQTATFYLVEKLMVVKGRINSSGEELDFLIDTGSQNSMVSIPAAKKYARIDFVLSSQLRGNAGVSGVGGVAKDVLYAQNVKVGIGSLEKNIHPMVALNLSEMCESINLELDLILGRDFLAGYTLLLDYQNRQITFLK